MKWPRGWGVHPKTGAMQDGCLESVGTMFGLSHSRFGVALHRGLGSNFDARTEARTWFGEVEEWRKVGIFTLKQKGQSLGVDQKIFLVGR